MVWVSPVKGLVAVPAQVVVSVMVRVALGYGPSRKDFHPNSQNSTDVHTQPPASSIQCVSSRVTGRET